MYQEIGVAQNVMQQRKKYIDKCKVTLIKVNKDSGNLIHFSSDNTSFASNEGT